MAGRSPSFDQRGSARGDMKYFKTSSRTGFATSSEPWRGDHIDLYENEVVVWLYTRPHEDWSLYLTSRGLLWSNPPDYLLTYYFVSLHDDDR